MHAVTRKTRYCFVSCIMKTVKSKNKIFSLRSFIFDLYKNMRIYDSVQTQFIIINFNIFKQLVIIN